MGSRTGTLQAIQLEHWIESGRHCKCADRFKTLFIWREPLNKIRILERCTLNNNIIIVIYKFQTIDESFNVIFYKIKFYFYFALKILVRVHIIYELLYLSNWVLVREINQAQNIVTSHIAKLKWQRFPLLLVNRGTGVLFITLEFFVKNILGEDAIYYPFQSDADFYSDCYFFFALYHFWKLIILSPS